MEFATTKLPGRKREARKHTPAIDRINKNIDSMISKISPLANRISIAFMDVAEKPDERKMLTLPDYRHFFIIFSQQLMLDDMSKDIELVKGSSNKAVMEMFQEYSEKMSRRYALIISFDIKGHWDAVKREIGNEITDIGKTGYKPYLICPGQITLFRFFADREEAENFQKENNMDFI